MIRHLSTALSRSITSIIHRIAEIREIVKPEPTFNLERWMRPRQTVNVVRTTCEVLSRPAARRRVMLMVAQ